MQIIPVLDLKGGLVVRGVAGKRDLYKPVESELCSSAEPVEVAVSLWSELGLGRMYLADLDAITGGEADLETCASLEELGFELMIDAGIRSIAGARQLTRRLDGEVIAALETLPGPRLLSELVGELGAQRVIFSLDLAAGKPLSGGGDWPATVDEIASAAVSAGIERMILLDLAAVGIGGGPAHLDRCLAWKDRFEGLELITGGGVRNLDDLLSLRAAGVDGVLIASALHDGRIGPGELGRLAVD